MSDIGTVGATAVSTIGTIAVVGIAAKTAGNIVKSTGAMPRRSYKGTTGYKLSHNKLLGSNSKRSSKKFSIWK